MTFTGFPPALFEFYAGLEADNSKAYWQTHKDVYETVVRATMEELAAELEEEFGQVHMYRPYRDLRFSADKRPYKENASFSVHGWEGGGYYLQIGPEGLYLGGGAWQPARDQLERWREAVDDSSVASGLEKLLESLKEAGYPLSEYGLKTVPRGYDRDHPRADLLKRTSLIVGHLYKSAKWLQQPKALEVIRKGWGHTREWGNWLHEHVGPSQEESRRR
jgi:uncharacterized protein (TIGR02453 family)